MKSEKRRNRDFTLHLVIHGSSSDSESEEEKEKEIKVYISSEEETENKTLKVVKKEEKVDTEEFKENCTEEEDFLSFGVVMSQGFNQQDEEDDSEQSEEINETNINETAHNENNSIYSQTSIQNSIEEQKKVTKLNDEPVTKVEEKIKEKIAPKMTEVVPQVTNSFVVNKIIQEKKSPDVADKMELEEKIPEKEIRQEATIFPESRSKQNTKRVGDPNQFTHLFHFPEATNNPPDDLPKPKITDINGTKKTKKNTGNNTKNNNATPVKKVIKKVEIVQDDSEDEMIPAESSAEEQEEELFETVEIYNQPKFEKKISIHICKTCSTEQSNFWINDKESNFYCKLCGLEFLKKMQKKQTKTVEVEKEKEPDIEFQTLESVFKIDDLMSDNPKRNKSPTKEEEISETKKRKVDHEETKDIHDTNKNFSNILDSVFGF
eukprot:gene9507-1713_t